MSKPSRPFRSVAVCLSRVYLSLHRRRQRGASSIRPRLAELLFQRCSISWKSPPARHTKVATEKICGEAPTAHKSPSPAIAPSHKLAEVEYPGITATIGYATCGRRLLVHSY